MKKSLLSLLALCAMAITPAHSAVTFSLQRTTSTSSSVDLTAGDTFRLVLSLTSDEEFVFGFTSFLEVSESTGSGLFTIVNRDLTGSLFNDPTSTNAQVLASANAVLNPRNVVDLGATLADPTEPVSPGTYLLATFTLQVATSAPTGLYTIQTSPDSIVSVANLGGSGQATQGFEDVSVSQTQFDVQVIPEPSTALLSLAGAATLLLRRRRSS